MNEILGNNFICKIYIIRILFSQNKILSLVCVYTKNVAAEMDYTNYFLISAPCLDKY